ncbi:hypothetical protein NDU88_002624 [Pleurodeles waltl]|uniref:Uncharacterized protein n=1 Tax=Pleurodeles waltl TaxID=8319 RepID=A0AAV7P772_PLEWA|nr:hypothetical protein NDU88_002624 [Pleurodeles waltl]
MGGVGWAAHTSASFDWGANAPSCPLAIPIALCAAPPTRLGYPGSPLLAGLMCGEELGFQAQCAQKSLFIAEDRLEGKWACSPDYLKVLDPSASRHTVPWHVFALLLQESAVKALPLEADFKAILPGRQPNRQSKILGACVTFTFKPSAPARAPLPQKGFRSLAYVLAALTSTGRGGGEPTVATCVPLPSLAPADVRGACSQSEELCACVGAEWDVELWMKELMNSHIQKYLFRKHTGSGEQKSLLYAFIQDIKYCLYTRGYVVYYLYCAHL